MYSFCFFYIFFIVFVGLLKLTITPFSTHSIVDCLITTLDKKKRTILEIRGEKNAVPRVISCSITSDQRRARSDQRLSATFALH